MDDSKGKNIFTKLNEYTKLEILGFIEPKNVHIITYFMFPEKNFRKKFLEILPTYLENIIVNKESFQKILENDSSQIFNILYKEVLPFHAFYSDGGYRMDFIGTDSFHDEAPSVYLNNLFNLRQASIYFREENYKNINVLSGLPYYFDSKTYYKNMKFFKQNNYKDSIKIIQQYIQIYSKLFRILRENGLNFNDFLMIFFNIQDYEIAYYPRVDFEKEELFNIMKYNLKIPEETINFFENLPSYDIGRYNLNHSLEIFSKEIYEDCLKSTLVFLIKEFCLINNKGPNRFAIFISEFNLKFNLKNEFRELSKFYEFTNKKDLCDIIKDRNEDIINHKTSCEKMNYIEFNLRKFKQIIKPLLIVDVKRNFDFEKITLNQYFIGKWIIVKKIQNYDNLEFISNEDDKFVKETDYDQDFIYSWDAPSLPKILIYGNMFNL